MHVLAPNVCALRSACGEFLNACKCSICWVPWQKASTFPCGHTFCYDCAMSTLEGPGISQSECPTCKGKYWKRDLKPNPQMMAVVEHAQKILSVAAALEAAGCSGIESLGDVAAARFLPDRTGGYPGLDTDGGEMAGGGDPHMQNVTSRLDHAHAGDVVEAQAATTTGKQAEAADREHLEPRPTRRLVHRNGTGRPALEAAPVTLGPESQSQCSAHEPVDKLHEAVVAVGISAARVAVCSLEALAASPAGHPVEVGEGCDMGAANEWCSAAAAATYRPFAAVESLGATAAGTGQLFNGEALPADGLLADALGRPPATSNYELGLLEARAPAGPSTTPIAQRRAFDLVATILTPLERLAPPPHSNAVTSLGATTRSSDRPTIGTGDGTGGARQLTGSVVSIIRATPTINNAYLDFHALLEHPVNCAGGLASAQAGLAPTFHAATWGSWDEVAGTEWFRRLASLPGPTSSEREALEFEASIVELFLGELETLMAQQQTDAPGVDAGEAAPAPTGGGGAIGKEGCASGFREWVGKEAASAEGCKGHGQGAVVGVAPCDANAPSAHDCEPAWQQDCRSTGVQPPPFFAFRLRQLAAAGVSPSQLLTQSQEAQQRTADAAESRPIVDAADVLAPAFCEASNSQPGAENAGALEENPMNQNGGGNDMIVVRHQLMRRGGNACIRDKDVPIRSTDVQIPGCCTEASTRSCPLGLGTAIASHGAQCGARSAAVEDSTDGEAACVAALRKRPRMQSPILRLAAACAPSPPQHPSLRSSDGGQSMVAADCATERRRAGSQNVVVVQQHPGETSPAAALQPGSAEDTNGASNLPRLATGGTMKPGGPENADAPEMVAVATAIPLEPKRQLPAHGPLRDQAAEVTGAVTSAAEPGTTEAAVKKSAGRRRSDGVRAKRHRLEPVNMPLEPLSMNQQLHQPHQPHQLQLQELDSKDMHERHRQASRAKAFKRIATNVTDPATRGLASVPAMAPVLGQEPVGLGPGGRRTKPLYLLPSGLGSEDRARVKELTRRVRGVELLSEVQPHLTHLVMHLDSEQRATGRTIKYLHAVMQGCWVVGTQWVEHSLAAGRLLPEGAFEARGDNVHVGAPALARLRVERGDQPLFSSLKFCVMYLKGSFDRGITKPELEALLQTSGGTLVRRPAHRTAATPTATTAAAGAVVTAAAALFGAVAACDLYEANLSPQQATPTLAQGASPPLPGFPPVLVLVAPDTVVDVARVIREWGYAPVQTLWVYDCISKYRLLPVEGYTIRVGALSHGMDGS